MSPTIMATPIDSRLLTLGLKNIIISHFTIIKKETLEDSRARRGLARAIQPSFNLWRHL